jgi:hypothetical protein
LQVLSELLDYLTSAASFENFLSKQLRMQSQPLYDIVTGIVNTYAPFSVIDVSLNADAKPGTMLYERFLDVMVQSAASYGGK